MRYMASAYCGYSDEYFKPLFDREVYFFPLLFVYHHLPISDSLRHGSSRRRSAPIPSPARNVSYGGAASVSRSQT